MKLTTSSAAIYLRLFKSVKSYWLLLAIGLIGTLIGSGIDAVITWSVKPLFDKGLVARQKSFLSFLPYATMAIFILRGGANFLSDYCISRVGRSVVMDFRQSVFNHLLKLPAKFYDEQSSGKLLSLISYNIEQLASATTQSVLTIVSEGALAVSLLTAMLILNWQLTLLFMAISPIVAIVAHCTSIKLRKLSTNVQQSMAEAMHIAGESINGYRVVRAFNGEDYEKMKFTNAILLNRYKEIKTIATNSLGTSGIQILVAIPIAIIIYFATSSFLNVTVGTFGAIVATILRILTPIKRLSRISTSIQKGIASAQTIFSLLDEKPEIDNGDIPLKQSSGKIEYQNVKFSYSNSSHLILDDINFVAKPKQVIAIVGQSGGGKSTLISLLPRFYDIENGKILIDDIDIRKYKLHDLRNQIGLVSQDVTLFNDSIANNIAYGRSERTSLDDIKQAAKAAIIIDDIERLPNGFNTIIGEHGLLLSGGQRQRLAIARAILKNAPILILDEATSSLDSESERCLQDALKTLMKNRTTLVIAHRLSTVEHADMIIVIEKGKIVERGTHNELINNKGCYAKLYNLQFHDQ